MPVACLCNRPICHEHPRCSQLPSLGLAPVGPCHALAHLAFPHPRARPQHSVEEPFPTPRPRVAVLLTQRLPTATASPRRGPPGPNSAQRCQLCRAWGSETQAPLLERDRLVHGSSKPASHGPEVPSTDQSRRPTEAGIRTAIGHRLRRQSPTSDTGSRPWRRISDARPHHRACYSQEWRATCRWAVSALERTTNTPAENPIPKSATLARGATG